ncbi:MAG TPA: hypothetical protein VEK33_10090 [Terriglobales bacterium]|nr:hypothetical protein [Terriglobales bacterium]
MTPLGVFFLPLILLCFLWRPFYLLPLWIIASIFEAGSVFNGEIGDFEFGISPFYLIEVFILLRFAMQLFRGTDLLPSKNSPVRTLTVLLCALWAWAFASAFILPQIFAGTLVAAPRGNVEDFTPLQWTLSNFAQAGYLTLNVSTALYAIHAIRTYEQTEQLMKALYCSLFIAVVLGLAQFVSNQAGWDFPYELFNNNPTYAHGIDQELGTVHRINSTFTEPSNAGSFLAALLCGLLAGFLDGGRNLRWLLAILGTVTVLLLTTSSTGFVAFLGGFCLLLVYFNPFRKSSVLAWLIVLAVVGVGATVLLFTPDLLLAITAMTLEKGESYSFWVRVADELHSLEIFVSTYGLGVGLGSNRSSGLIATMLSTVGIVGTGLLAAFYYRTVKAFLSGPVSRSMQVTFWALVTLTIAESVAVPDLNRPILWTMFLVVLTQLSVGFVSHPSRESAREARSRPIRSGLDAPGVAPAS